MFSMSKTLGLEASLGKSERNNSMKKLLLALSPTDNRSMHLFTRPYLAVLGIAGIVRGRFAH
jgi:hypothetical protein